MSQKTRHLWMIPLIRISDQHWQLEKSCPRVTTISTTVNLYKKWPILNSSPSSTLLVYIHIPKTGGSSFKNALHDRITHFHYPKNHAFFDPTDQNPKPKFPNYFPNERAMPWTHPGCGRKGQPMGIHSRVGAAVRKRTNPAWNMRFFRTAHRTFSNWDRTISGILKSI